MILSFNPVRLSQTEPPRLPPQPPAPAAHGNLRDVVTLGQHPAANPICEAVTASPAPRGESQPASPPRPSPPVVIMQEPEPIAAVEAVDDHPMRGIPEEALVWIALAPAWTTTLAAKCGFPTESVSAEEGWHKLSRMGLCSIAKNTDEDGGLVVIMDPDRREAVLGDLRSDPDRGQPYIIGEMKKVGQAIVDAQLQDTSAVISQVSLRWAMLAAHADDTDAMQTVLQEKLDFLYGEGRGADAQRWITAAEVVNDQLDGAFAQEVGWAKRQDRTYQRGAAERRRQEYFSNISEMVDHGVTRDSLIWAGLIPRWTPDMTIACKFPARNLKAEFTFEALEAMGMATMGDDQASLNLRVGDAIIDYFKQDAKTGPDYLKGEMVKVGAAVVAAHAQGVDVDPNLVKMATLYEKAADPAAAAQFLRERLDEARANQDEGDEKAWEYASSRVGKVLGDQWKPDAVSSRG